MPGEPSEQNSLEILRRVKAMESNGQYKQPRPLTDAEIAAYMHPELRSEETICREIFAVFEKAKRFPQ